MTNWAKQPKLDPRPTAMFCYTCSTVPMRSTRCFSRLFPVTLSVRKASATALQPTSRLQINSRRMTQGTTSAHAFSHSTLAIPAHEDDAAIRAKYRPFLLGDEIESTDWVSQLELDVAMNMARQNIESTGSRLKVLVLYGSLRKRFVFPCHFIWGLVLRIF